MLQGWPELAAVAEGNAFTATPAFLIPNPSTSSAPLSLSDLQTESPPGLVLSCIFNTLTSNSHVAPPGPEHSLPKHLHPGTVQLHAGTSVPRPVLEGQGAPSWLSRALPPCFITWAKPPAVLWLLGTDPLAKASNLPKNSWVRAGQQPWSPIGQHGAASVQLTGSS